MNVCGRTLKSTHTALEKLLYKYSCSVCVVRKEHMLGFSQYKCEINIKEWLELSMVLWRPVEIRGFLSKIKAFGRDRLWLE